MTSVHPALDGLSTTDQPSDAELITAVRAGNVEAYDLLYRRHLGAARNLARQLTRSPAELDDLVAEAFAKMLDTLRGGGGPDTAFRAYLLTTLRHCLYDKTRRDRRLEYSDDLSQLDPGEPFVDTAVQGLEATLVARAFGSLPERWQTVLWHTEVEGETPAQVAPLLGLTPNGVSALAYRAREGLRQAYLQVHLQDTAGEQCRYAVERLGAWARYGLSKRERGQVDTHLSGCERCRALAAELADVNRGLRAIIAPLVIGLPWLAGYLGQVGDTAATAGAAGAGAATAGAAGGAAGTGTGAAGATAGGATGTAGTAGAGTTAAGTSAAGTTAAGTSTAGSAAAGTGAATSGATVAAAGTTAAGTAAAGTAAGTTAAGLAAAGTSAAGTSAAGLATAGTAAAGTGAAGLAAAAGATAAAGAGATGLAGVASHGAALLAKLLHTPVGQIAVGAASVGAAIAIGVAVLPAGDAPQAGRAPASPSAVGSTAPGSSGPSDIGLGGSSGPGEEGSSAGSHGRGTAPVPAPSTGGSPGASGTGDPGAAPPGGTAGQPPAGTTSHAGTPGLLAGTAVTPSPLQQGRPGVIQITVRNTGTGTMTGLRADITLPAGVVVRGSGGIPGRGNVEPSAPPPVAASPSPFTLAPPWLCDRSAAGATCRLTSLAAGGAAVIDLRVFVGVSALDGTLTGTVSTDDGLPVPIPPSLLEVQPS